jgi:uncharacterized protein (DUF488 family)
MTDTNNTIFAAGYRARRDALTWLKDQGVALVIDVRIEPLVGGRWDMRQLLGRTSSLGLEYWWLSEAGNPYYRKRPLEESLADFASYLSRTDVIARLVQSAEQKVIGLLCACVRRSRCHRGVILGRLEARGWTAVDMSDQRISQRQLF